MRLRVLFGVVAVSGIACGASHGVVEPKVETADVAKVDGGAVVAEDAGSPPARSVAANASAAFAEAEAAFARGDFDDAARRYSEVVRMFAYSSFAKTAQLRLADVLFERGRYADAAAEYARWSHEHRSDPRVDEVEKKQAEAAHRAKSP